MIILNPSLKKMEKVDTFSDKEFDSLMILSGIFTGIELRGKD